MVFRIVEGSGSVRWCLAGILLVWKMVYSAGVSQFVSDLVPITFR